MYGWFSHDSNSEWMEGYTTWVSHYQSYICVWQCVCVTMPACVRLCMKFASSSEVMNQIRRNHTRWQWIPCSSYWVHWTELSWRVPAGCDFDPHHNIHSSAPMLLFLLLIYPFGLKLLLPRLQIELSVVLNMEYPPVVTGYWRLASWSEAFGIVSDLKGEGCG